MKTKKGLNVELMMSTADCSIIGKDRAWELLNEVNEGRAGETLPLHEIAFLMAPESAERQRLAKTRLIEGAEHLGIPLQVIKKQ